MYPCTYGNENKGCLASDMFSTGRFLNLKPDTLHHQNSYFFFTFFVFFSFFFLNRLIFLARLCRRWYNRGGSVFLLLEELAKFIRFASYDSFVIIVTVSFFSLFFWGRREGRGSGGEMEKSSWFIVLSLDDKKKDSFRISWLTITLNSNGDRYVKSSRGSFPSRLSFT